jgi:hypothetical protein
MDGLPIRWMRFDNAVRHDPLPAGALAGFAPTGRHSCFELVSHRLLKSTRSVQHGVAMKLSSLAFAGILFMMLVVTADAACAQHPPIQYQPDNDSPVGERNAKSPQEVSQFGFLMGDWDVAITWYPPQGEPNTYAAK